MGREIAQNLSLINNMTTFFKFKLERYLTTRWKENRFAFRFLLVLVLEALKYADVSTFFANKFDKNINFSCLKVLTSAKFRY